MDRTFKILLTVGMVVLGSITFGVLGWEHWSEWEPNAARSITAEVLANFSAPCKVATVELSCDDQICSMPQGSYTFATVDTMPFQGVFVRVRYRGGQEVQLEVFPTLVTKPRAHILKVIQ